MCGRYTQTKAEALLRKRFHFREGSPELIPRYNVAPLQEASVVIAGEEGRLLVPMRWGLVPSWSESEAVGNRMINARAETLAEKPSFRDALRRRRCLVLADGFLEWRKAGSKNPKIPIRFVMKGEEPFAFAGLWENFGRADGEKLQTFTIVTTSANELVAEVHDRMPVILNEGDEEAWLDPRLTDPARVLPFLVPFPAAKMESYEVSPRLNSGRVDDPLCIEKAPAEKSKELAIGPQRSLFD